MKKTYSIRKVFLRMLLMMVAVSILCLLVCGGYALYSTQQELNYCSEAAVNLYFSGLTHTMYDLTAFSKNMLASDLDFQVLALGPDSVSEHQLLQARFNLRRDVHNRISANTGILIFDTVRDGQYYQWGQAVWQGLLQKETLHAAQEIRAFWENCQDPEQMGWQLFETEDHKVILMQASRYKGVLLCTAVDLSSYAQESQGGANATTFSMISREAILTNRDYAQEQGISLERMLEADGKTVYSHGHVLHTRLDAASGFGVCSMNPTRGIWGNWIIFLCLWILSQLLICLISWAVFGIVNKVLIYPIRKITEITGQIEQGSTHIEKTPERIQEIDEIQSALVTLVQQKVSLETERTRQESLKEHALLQYYQLQTRSHFLLNCLKSIYNLTARGEQEKTLHIVTRFSNHIRYVFHDSLTFVPVRAELDEVDDYFEIIGLERTDHIFLTKTVDAELLDFPIPPLLIQTFLENFQKHNAPGGRLLRFSIKIDHLEMEGHRYVRIRLSDTGVGYSEESLHQLQNLDGEFAQFHVGIQNLCRRIDILYKKQQKTAFFNLPGGGACSVFYIPADSYFSGEQQGGKEK